MPAASDWPRFSLDALTGLTPTAPVEGEGAQIDPTSPSLDPPAQSNVSLAQSNISSAQSNISSAQSNVSESAQSNVSPDRSNALLEPQDPAQPAVIANPQLSNPNVPTLPNPTLGRSDISDDQQDVGVVTTEPGIPHLPATATTVVPSATTSLSPPLPDSTHPSLSFGRTQRVMPRQSHSKASPMPSKSGSSHETAGRTTIGSTFNAIIGAVDESDWMERKGTLGYLRDIFKLGHLPDVIGRWYQLEKLLGFPESVGVFRNCCLPWYSLFLDPVWIPDHGTTSCCQYVLQKRAQL